MSLFWEQYNQTNSLNKEKQNITDVIRVSFFDVLKEKKIKRKILQVSDCLCISPSNIQTYYEKCPKCLGKKEIEMFNHTLSCNCCHGKGLVGKEVCPICEGKTKIIKKEEIEIELKKELLQNPILVVNGKGINQGDLVLKVEIYDKDCYFVKDDNIYSRKVIHFKKKEFKQSKEVETAVDFSSFKLDKIVYEQVVTLKGKGLNGKDFYQPVRCEVEGSKGNPIYSNIILDKPYSGVYVKKEDIYNHKNVLKYFLACPLNDPNYQYLDLSKFNKNYEVLTFEELGEASVDGGKNGDLYLKVFIGNYIVKDNAIYRTDEILTKTEISSNKKSIILNGEKILVNIDKEKEENYFLYMGKYGLLNKNNKCEDFYTLINKSYSIYQISTFNKEKHFYIEDYKHYFNEKVLSFSSNDNMENYIEVNATSNKIEVLDKDENKVIISLLKKEEL